MTRLAEATGSLFHSTVDVDTRAHSKLNGSNAMQQQSVTPSLSQFAAEYTTPKQTWWSISSGKAPSTFSSRKAYLLAIAFSYLHSHQRGGATVMARAGSGTEASARTARTAH